MQQKNSSHAEIVSASSRYQYGFTLIELLVVVLIIGVLTAIAIPQYQKAVLKSRFSSLMPLAKSVANAQEAYYLANGRYATNVNALDIDVPNDPKIGVNISQDTDGSYAYVLAYNDDINANYIVYQAHSDNFPYNIHCEADKNDSSAQWLCDKGLNGEYLTSGKSLSGGNWETYILEGSEYDGTFSACSGTVPENLESNRSALPSVGIASCDENTGQYRYEWSNVGSANVCTGDRPYTCAGLSFDYQSYSSCWGNQPYGCAGTTYSKNNSSCSGSEPYSCADTNFMGGLTYCIGAAQNACYGAHVYGKSYCLASVVGGCNGVSYLFDEKGYRGCCRGNYCPIGSPMCNTHLVWERGDKCWGEGRTAVACAD